MAGFDRCLQRQKMKDSFSINSPIQRFSEAFKIYTEYNKRDFTELFVRKSRSLAISIYMETPKVESMGVIETALSGLGWKVKRKLSVAQKRAIGKLKGNEALQAMHAIVAKIRYAHRQYVAAGWLPAARALGAALEHVREVKGATGSVEIQYQGSNPSVAYINTTNGIATLEERHNISGAAFDRETADIWEYIQRKLRENATIFNPSGA
jgi:hypothetical protein